ncbi:hypothetical protein CR983_00610 [Candidatus Saccharibacteria bacterium]|nr:MAG: hypothetical protein CR983_00610 [Candidatus Saccharibacteria bacterium]
MRRLSVVLLLAAAIVSASPASASELDARVLTDAQIDGIQRQCPAAKQRLRELHAADKVLRVNMMQQYEWISKRLMAPLNSRIALNGLDGVALSATSVSFASQVDAFREAYTRYDDATGQLRGIDCAKEPVRFYAALEAARVLRGEVDSITKKLAETGKQYRAQVDEFAKKEGV